MKSVKYLLGAVAAVIIIAGLFLYWQIYGTYDLGTESKSVIVQKDDSFRKLTDQLIEKKIIKSAFYFKLMAVLTDADKRLMPGRYDFYGEVSIKSIVKKISEGDIAKIKITIPEGFLIGQIAGRVASIFDLDSARFDSIATDTNFTQTHYGLNGMEGYLLPETYYLPYGLTEEDIIDNFYQQYKTLTEDIFDDSAPNDLEAHEIIVLASIIEAEARDIEEMRLISSVYHNRLAKRMKLQADPTVIYALGGLDRPLWTKDLKYDSPYNTYLHYGLPPGPINSPGIDAIKAAMDPEDSKYLYFVADGTGHHIFSETLKEHNRARRLIKSGQ